MDIIAEPSMSAVSWADRVCVHHEAYLGARVIFDVPLTLSAEDDGSLAGSLEAGGAEFAIYDDTIPFVNAEKKANEALAKLKVLSQDHQVTLIPGYVDCDTVLNEL